ncbi:MAG TPA: histidine kinase [Gemmatimonadaceae bacterium]|nr:histidine kinase [Gemmatimonadaceae bacterium]
MSRARIHWAFVVVATLVVTCLFTLASMGNPGAPRFAVLHDRELVTWLAWALLVPGIVWAVRRYPFGEGGPMGWLAKHLGLGFAFSLASLAIVEGVWVAMRAGHMSGMESMPGMDMASPGGIAMTVSRVATGLLVYGLVAIAYQALFYRRAAQERTALAARLRADLAEARLAGIEGKLHPHFLFNALNSIAALVRVDPGQAEAMIEQLSELLRAALKANPAEEAPLDDALRLTEQYLAIERVRFQARLRASVSATPDARKGRVPPLILQPIVENAVRHGLGSLEAGGSVNVTAKVDGDTLLMTVDDDGVGYGNAPPSRSGTGLGVKSVQSILAHLYGAKASLDIRKRSPRGTIVTIALPYRTA